MILKQCASALALPLFYIFNYSLETGSLPDVWKLANISPIFKKGSKLIPKNYRPVSLTSIPCKILESIIKDQISQHLETNKLISPCQHGFVKRKSCTTNLLETVDKITAAISKKIPIDIIYLDFAKAFDTVPHRRLILKLESYGIQGKLLNWIKSFLCNRSQRVVQGSVISDWKKVYSGVPQGSVLGPLLFLLYINDLPDMIQNDFKLFADDAKLISVIDEPDKVKLLQDDLDKVVEWSKLWLIKLNISKCKVMHFGTNNELTDYFLNDLNTNTVNKLTESDFERDLGVFISSNLKWNKQVVAASNKANQILGRMKKAFDFININTAKILYTSFIRPHMEFAISVWSPYLIGDINILEKTQRRATKMVSSIYNDSYEQRLKKFELTSLETRRLRGDLIQMYKIFHRLDKINNIPDFKNKNDASKLRVNDFRLEREIVKNCDQRYYFLYNRVAEFWNKLSTNEINSKSINIFKSVLDKHLKEKKFLLNFYK